jgi:hypothetical protein
VRRAGSGQPEASPVAHCFHDAFKDREDAVVETTDSSRKIAVGLTRGLAMRDPEPRTAPDGKYLIAIFDKIGSARPAPGKG